MKRRTRKPAQARLPRSRGKSRRRSPKQHAKVKWEYVAGMKELLSRSRMPVPELRQLAQDGKAESIRLIAESHVQLAYKIAEKFAADSTTAEQEDLLGEALAGLVLGASRWNPDKGADLTLWLTYYVRGAVLDYLKPLTKWRSLILSGGVEDAYDPRATHASAYANLVIRRVLTDREKRAVEMRVSGFTNAETAKRMHVSAKTAERLWYGACKKIEEAA